MADSQGQEDEEALDEIIEELEEKLEALNERQEDLEQKIELKRARVREINETIQNLEDIEATIHPTGESS